MVPAYLVVLILLQQALNTAANDYVLSVQWTKSVCRYEKQNCSMNNVKNEWTVHGLWPPELGKESNVEFDVKAFTPVLRTKLDNVWPSVLKKNRNEDFWKHEWDRHGKQAINDPASGIKNQTQYFALAVELLQSLNLKTKLSSCGIKPREQPYKAIEIMDCLKKYNISQYQYNFNTEDAGKPGHWLMEIRLCYQGNNITQIKQRKDCQYSTHKNGTWKLLYPEEQSEATDTTTVYLILAAAAVLIIVAVICIWRARNRVKTDNRDVQKRK